MNQNILMLGVRLDCREGLSLSSCVEQFRCHLSGTLYRPSSVPWTRTEGTQADSIRWQSFSLNLKLITLVDWLLSVSVPSPLHHPFLGALMLQPVFICVPIFLVPLSLFLISGWCCLFLFLPSFPSPLLSSPSYFTLLWNKVPDGPSQPQTCYVAEDSCELRL